MISLKVDGIPIRVAKGSTVLDAARHAKVYVPTLCYQPELERFGACRLCLVEVEGFKKTCCCMYYSCDGRYGGKDKNSRNRQHEKDYC